MKRVGFKLTIRRESGQDITVSSPSEDLNFEDLLDLFRGFALAAGYHRDTINDGIEESMK